MSKKKKKNRPQPSRLLAPAKFATGTQVRVRLGTADPDFPDIPPGGWSGTVIEVDQRSNPPGYLIKWDQGTLAAMHPVFRTRCERDDLELDSMWLDENDIESDPGEPAVIEQPTEIVTRPLRMNDQDDRIRAILGVTGDDPLPDVDEATLCKYHRHLAENLTFPLQASYEEQTGPFEDKEHQITITALLDPHECDEDEGLLCEAQEGAETKGRSHFCFGSTRNDVAKEDHAKGVYP